MSVEKNPTNEEKRTKLKVACVDCGKVGHVILEETTSWRFTTICSGEENEYEWEEWRCYKCSEEDDTNE